MLGAQDPEGRRTGRQAVLYTGALVVASLALTPLGLTGGLYLAAAPVLGLAFVAAGGVMATSPTPRHARRLFLASVEYLPALLLFTVLDKVGG